MCMYNDMCNSCKMRVPKTTLCKWWTWEHCPVAWQDWNPFPALETPASCKQTVIAAPLCIWPRGFPKPLSPTFQFKTSCCPWARLSLLAGSLCPAPRPLQDSESLSALPLRAAPFDPPLLSCSTFSGAKPYMGLVALCCPSQGWGCRIPCYIPKHTTTSRAGWKAYMERSESKGNLKKKCYQWAK